MQRHTYEPIEFVWGADATAELPGILEGLGCDRAMVVCGAHTADNGVADRVATALGDRHAGTYDGARPEKTVASVRAGVDAKRELSADALVSVGGGTATDTAKAIAVLAAEPGCSLPEMRATTSGGTVSVPALPAAKDPILAVSTTLSAAEISKGFGVTDPDAGEQFVVLDEKIRPEACVYDPDLARTTPAGVVASSGMAAVDHAVEIMYSATTASNPFYLATAAEALDLLTTHLPGAYNQADREALGRAQLGAAMSGLGATEVCVNHGINHVLTARHPLTHGEGNCILLPHGLRYNFEAVPDRLPRIARAFGVEDADADRETLKATVAAIETLQGALDMPTRLRDVGVDRDDFDATARLAVDDPMMANNPRDVTQDDVLSILKAAW